MSKKDKKHKLCNTTFVATLLTFSRESSFFHPPKAKTVFKSKLTRTKCTYRGILSSKADIALQTELFISNFPYVYRENICWIHLKYTDITAICMLWLQLITSINKTNQYPQALYSFQSSKTSVYESNQSSPNSLHFFPWNSWKIHRMNLFKGKQDLLVCQSFRLVATKRTTTEIGKILWLSR